MKNVSIYAVGRNEFGFGILIEGDETYVTEAHDAEKSDLTKFMESVKKCCISNSIDKEVFNFVAPYGKEGRYLVLAAGEVTNDLGNTGFGVTIMSCDNKGENEKYTFSKEEASDIAKTAERLLYRAENCVIAKTQNREASSLTTINRNIFKFNQNAQDLSNKLNNFSRLSAMKRAAEMPVAKQVREQVAIAM